MAVQTMNTWTTAAGRSSSASAMRRAPAAQSEHVGDNTATMQVWSDEESKSGANDGHDLQVAVPASSVPSPPITHCLMGAVAEEHETGEYETLPAAGDALCARLAL